MEPAVHGEHLARHVGGSFGKQEQHGSGDLLGALHAAEHALIALLPLWAMCDRWDIGGLSTAWHWQTDLATVFIYDGHPGGIGITRTAFQRFEELCRDAQRLIAECPCASGCPSASSWPAATPR